MERSSECKRRAGIDAVANVVFAVVNWCPEMQISTYLEGQSSPYTRSLHHFSSLRIPDWYPLAIVVCTEETSRDSNVTAQVSIGKVSRLVS